MTRGTSAYHRRIAAENRATILTAAAGAFLQFGYDRTSLARIAADAGVSKATLFKQFPTKAELFEATVLDVGGRLPGSEFTVPSDVDLRTGLQVVGDAYVALLDRPGMAELLRIVIAESPQFPELRERTFDFGSLPVLTALNRLLEGTWYADGADAPPRDVIAAQFLGMIATVVFWPRLLHGGWELSADEKREVVAHAVQTIVARCEAAQA
ncbi:MAG: TetR family transcriptional regulator [Microbacterium sp. 69-10]|uniref:TetR/AcrR family transcriptional regulator n=1 Tax=Microbacterium sp. 69-10 TaxID=1895783 RepID=UPI00095B393F|nr:TetR/AcrR family transcriptional regulator [Microbacterium sp. 69-10]OJU40931.1 MAG: TetR family transcriptional regulator [Microbacterium sp. 69-10]